jgi:hypothetical protein
VESVDEEEIEPPKETQPLLKEVTVADAPVVTYQEYNGYYDNDEVEEEAREECEEEHVEEEEKDEETDSDDVIIELLFTTVCTKNH